MSQDSNVNDTAGLCTLLCTTVLVYMMYTLLVKVGFPFLLFRLSFTAWCSDARNTASDN